MMLNRVIYIIIINLLLSLSGFGQKIYFSNGENGTFETSKIYVIENSYCEVIDSFVTNERSHSFCVSDNDSLLYNMELISIPNANGDDSPGISIYKYHTDGSFIENVLFEYETVTQADNIIYKNADTLLVTGGRGYTIIDLKNNTFNYILTIPQISFPHDISFYRNRAFVLDFFADRVVSFDLEQNLFFDDPSWSFINPIASGYRTTSISMLGDCGSPQDFVIYKRETFASDELHYTRSPDFVTDVICKVGSRINDNEVVRAIPYPLILDLDSSTDYCESNDTIISLTLCSDNEINLDGLHPYLEEYDDHIDSMTINIVDGPLAVTLDYNLSMLDKNIINNKSLVLSNTGISTIQDFTDAITSLSIENIPDDNTSRIEIEFQLFSYIRQSLPATVVLELTQEDTNAGRDTSLTFCPNVTVIDLNDYVDVAASTGIWPMGSLYDPATSTSENIPYVVEGLICPNDTAIYSIDLYPEAISQSEIISFCEGDSVLYRGEYYSQDVDILDTIPSVLSGCDSLYQMVEIRNSDTPLFARIDTTLCDGVIIDFGGQQLSASGMYRDTLHNSAGCDSVITEITLSYAPTAQMLVIDTVICSGTSLEIGGRLIDSPLVEMFSIPNVIGCDSITYDLSVMVTSVEEVTIDTLLCSGESIPIGNQTFSEATQDTLLLLDNQGCDSIQYVIDIRYKELQEAFIDTLLCAGEEFNFLGQTYTGTGSDQIVLLDSEGCDSLVINLNLEHEQALFLPDQRFDIPLSIPTPVSVEYDLDYESLTWLPQEGLSCTDCLEPEVMITEDMVYNVVIENVNGCKDIIEVSISVLAIPEASVDAYYLPNVIDTRSSNNNRFYIQTASDVVMTYSLSVYDRWGNQFFSSDNILSNDVESGWDGHHQNGAELSQGVYVYKIVTEEGKVISGDILVLR
jgi:hypothetical protein